MLWLDGFSCYNVTPVEGAGVFDLQIVATMLASGVQRIYTFNIADFEIFRELIVIAPF